MNLATLEAKANALGQRIAGEKQRPCPNPVKIETDNRKLEAMLDRIVLAVAAGEDDDPNESEQRILVSDTGSKSPVQAARLPTRRPS